MGKYSVHSSQWQKKEWEKKRIQKAATLRKYAKLCKQEGIDSERVNLGNRDRDSARPNHKENNDTRLPPKVLEKQLKKKEEKELKRQLADQKTKENMRKIEESLHKRKQLKKIMTKKTKKGQPVMEGRIKNMLSKIQMSASHQ